MPRLNRFEWLKGVLQAKDLTSTAQLVASALSVQFANDETGLINPGLATLMKYLGMARSTLKRVIKELVDTGWLSRTEGRGAGNCTSYTLLAPYKLVPFRQKPKDPNASLSTQKKGSQMAQKGSTGELSYKEQSKQQKARPSPPPDLPCHGQPGCALRFVPGGGGYFEREWDDALQSYGLSSLHRALPQIINHGQKGYLLPDRCPARRGSSLRDQQILIVKQLMEAHRNASELVVAA